MKKIVLTILLQCLVMSASAVRLNEDGLKMVSEVEIFYGCLHKITFKYNAQNRLIAITAYLDEDWDEYKDNADTYVPHYKFYAEYKLMDGKMICKRNDPEYSAPLYDFKFDERGHILSFKEKLYNDYEGRKFILREYDYAYDPRRKRNILTYRDMYPGRYEYINEGEGVDRDHVNDTNISTEWMLTFPIYCHSVDYFFLLTEWADCINDFHPKERYTNHYDYIYDSWDNLVEIIENKNPQDCFTHTEVINGVEHKYPYSVMAIIRIKYVD